MRIGRTFRDVNMWIADRPRIRAVVVLIFVLQGLLVTEASAELQLDGQSSNSVTLSWTAPGDDGATGSASQYDMRYATSPITEENFDAATQVAGLPAPQPAGSSETFTVTGLAENTTYYFAIRAADEVPNWSGLSNVVTAATDPEGVAPAAVANLTVEGVTVASATLTWTAPGDDGTTGTASQYDIRYSTSPINASNFASASQVSGEPSPSAAGSDESFTVTGLSENTTYYFAIKTADEVPNWSAISNIANGTTNPEQTPPDAVADLQIDGATASSVTLSWTATGDDGSSGTASQYDLRYSTSPINASNFASATPCGHDHTPNAPGTEETCTITDLSQEVTYYFAIRVADEVPNWSDISNVVNTTTPDETAPVAISDLSAE